MEKTGIELLTELQTELGYVAGPISTVALLGLVGEAGEVLAETHVSLFNDRMVHTVCNAIRACADADKLKKDIRKEKASGSITLEPDRELAFDIELADTFYYMKAVAANRGLTLDDLAKISHDKVRAKMESGKSSEQYQKFMPGSNSLSYDMGYSIDADKSAVRRPTSRSITVDSKDGLTVHEGSIDGLIHLSANSIGETACGYYNNDFLTTTVPSEVTCPDCKGAYHNSVRGFHDAINAAFSQEPTNVPRETFPDILGLGDMDENKRYKVEPTEDVVHFRVEGMLVATCGAAYGLPDTTDIAGVNCNECLNQIIQDDLKENVPRETSEEENTIPVVDIIEPEPEPDLSLLHWRIAGVPTCDIHKQFPDYTFLTVVRSTDITCPVCKDIEENLPF